MDRHRSNVSEDLSAWFLHFTTSHLLNLLGASTQLLPVNMQGVCRADKQLDLG
jgi:hypothetical protein